jgi:hypothetical protein
MVAGYEAMGKGMSFPIIRVAEAVAAVRAMVDRIDAAPD